MVKQILSGMDGVKTVGDRPRYVERAAVWAPAIALRFALAGLVLAVLSPGPAFSQAQQKTQKAARQQTPAPANMDQAAVLILIRSALLALDQANKTGNYTVLRDLGAPGFQANSAARLAEIFAPQRQQALDLGEIAVLEPQLTLSPQIEPNGMLHLGGFFPSVPTRIDFELLFAPHNQQWRLFGLSVNLSQGAPEKR